MKTIGILTAMLTLVLAAPAFAGDHGEGEGDGEHKGCGCGGEFQEKLGLTAEQQEAVDALKEAMHADKTAMHEQVEALMGEMEALWGADELDRAAITAKAEEMMVVKSQMHLRKLQFKLDMLELLTPEQRAMAQQHMWHKMAAERGGDEGGHGCKGEHGDGGHGSKGCSGCKGDHAEGGEPCEHHAE